MVFASKLLLVPEQPTLENAQELMTSSAAKPQRRDKKHPSMSLALTTPGLTKLFDSVKTILTSLDHSLKLWSINANQMEEVLNAPSCKLWRLETRPSEFQNGLNLLSGLLEENLNALSVPSWTKTFLGTFLLLLIINPLQWMCWVLVGNLKWYLHLYLCLWCCYRHHSCWFLLRSRRRYCLLHNQVVCQVLRRFGQPWTWPKFG